MAPVPLPAPLTPGTAVGLIAPSSPPKDPAQLEAGVAYLESRGLQVVRGREVLTPRGYLAGPDEARLAELNGFLRRTDLQALFCVRGGYGALRLLASLDYAAARRHPKLLIGYSDVTALHLALYRAAGWRGLSGPLVVEWDAPDAGTERQFWAMAGGATPATFVGPAGEALHPMRPGTAEGVLLGGNLTMVVRLLGTPFLPALDGALLFIEEVGEQPYRLDGLLAQLKLAGVWDRLGGLIVGGLTEWQPPHSRPTLTPSEVLHDYLRDAPFPVATGLVYGHFPVKSTVPVGVRARLTVEADAARLSILDPVVA